MIAWFAHKWRSVNWWLALIASVQVCAAVHLTLITPFWLLPVIVWLLAAGVLFWWVE